MMEFYLNFIYYERNNTYIVYSRFALPNHMADSVLTVDYNYRPWPRKEGNLLW